VSASLDARLAALRDAAEVARGRLDDERVDAADAVVRRAGQRLGLGMEATVVALAGPTGAGKSTLFNALAGRPLVEAGRRRPTTSASTAAVWGEVPEPLLAWLEVARRHRLGDDGRPAGGIVLLDLPDFDSVALDHRAEVERVLALADLFVWVVDPQKYADAAWHERYLRGMAAHAGVMEVVLNQADLLGDGAVEACRADLQRLLSADGLPKLPVHAVSAVTGDGVEALRAAIERRASARTAAVERLGADVATAAASLGESCGGSAAGVSAADRERLVSALADAAGVSTVMRAVERAHRRRGALATGWPVARSLRRLRPDPLRRLRLPDRGGAADHPSLPEPTAVQRAGVATAARALAAAAAGDLADPWPRLVRETATGREAGATQRLSTTLGQVDLRVTRPRWWGAVDLAQRGLAAVAAVGALWLLALLALAWLRVDDLVPTPEVEGIAVPTLLAVGGAVAGLLVALAARVVNGVGARRRARRAERALRARVREVADEEVVGPVEAELAARRRLCEAVSAADGARVGRRFAT